MLKKYAFKTILNGKIKLTQDSLQIEKMISLMNYEDELNLLKNNVMNLIRSLNLNLICVNVVPKKNHLK